MRLSGLRDGCVCVCVCVCVCGGGGGGGGGVYWHGSTLITAWLSFQMHCDIFPNCIFSTVQDRTRWAISSHTMMELITYTCLDLRRALNKSPRCKELFYSDMYISKNTRGYYFNVCEIQRNTSNFNPQHLQDVITWHCLDTCPCPYGISPAL